MAAAIDGRCGGWLAGGLMRGSVVAVPVHEGDRVAAGQLLVRLDARDLDAKRAQVEAGLAEASAVYNDATVQTGRIRALYADSAATKAQLDQAETGLARATAAVASARAMAAELAATASYAEVRAPFAGVVTHRFVDPGSFAAPGAPLVTVEDAGTLRVTVSAAPDANRSGRSGFEVNSLPKTMKSAPPDPSIALPDCWSNPPPAANGPEKSGRRISKILGSGGVRSTCR